MCGHGGRTEEEGGRTGGVGDREGRLKSTKRVAKKDKKRRKFDSGGERDKCENLKSLKLCIGFNLSRIAHLNF